MVKKVSYGLCTVIHICPAIARAIPISGPPGQNDKFRRQHDDCGNPQGNQKSRVPNWHDPCGCELVSRGHQVWVENNGGAGIGFDNASYEAAGAYRRQCRGNLCQRRTGYQGQRTQPNECRMLRPGQILFTTCSPIRSRLPCLASGFRRLLMKRTSPRGGSSRWRP